MTRHDDAAATAKADLAPLHLLVNWLLAKFGEGDATYVAFRLGGLTVVAARGGTADGLEEFVDDLGGAVQDAPGRESRRSTRRGGAGMNAGDGWDELLDRAKAVARVVSGPEAAGIEQRGPYSFSAHVRDRGARRPRVVFRARPPDGKLGGDDRPHVRPPCAGLRDVDPRAARCESRTTWRQPGVRRRERGRRLMRETRRYQRVSGVERIGSNR